MSKLRLRLIFLAPEYLELYPVIPSRGRMNQEKEQLWAEVGSQFHICDLFRTESKEENCCCGKDGVNYNQNKNNINTNQ